MVEKGIKKISKLERKPTVKQENEPAWIQGFDSAMYGDVKRFTKGRQRGNKCMTDARCHHHLQINRNNLSELYFYECGNENHQSKETGDIEMKRGT